MEKSIETLIETVSKVYIQSYKLDILADDLMRDLIKIAKPNLNDESLINYVDEVQEFIDENLEFEKSDIQLSERVKETLTNILSEAKK